MPDALSVTKYFWLNVLFFLNNESSFDYVKKCKHVV